MNINRLNHAVILVLAIALILLISPLSYAKQVDLKVNLATPVMPAETISKAFIKISLEGIRREQVQQRIAANIAIVLDKSGSMQGEKLFRAKEAAIMAINRLDDNDIISVVSYDSRVNVVVPATKVRDRQSIARAIERIQADGNTALFAGVSKGAYELRKFLERNKVNRVILLSDGLANVGPSTPHDLGQLGLSLAKEGISVTTIGLGLGYNEDLMTQLAGFSDGNHAFVENATDLSRIFQYEFGDVLSVVAQGVEITIQCRDGVKPLRVLGREANIRGNQVQTRLNQLYSKQEKFIILEVEIPSQQDQTDLALVDVEVNYLDLINQQNDRITDSAIAHFTRSEEAINQAVDMTTYEAAAEQVANEYNKEAVKKRDQGDIEGAKNILQKSAQYLDTLGQSLASPKLLEQREEALQDADELENEQEWSKKRKELRERQYKRATQQSY